MFAILIGLLAYCGQAEATWYWAHGSSGDADDGDDKRTSRGLRVSPDGDKTVWVHFQVPTVGDKSQGAQYVRMRFNILKALNSRISQVRVYNGGSLVKSFNVSWGTLGAQTKTLNLGSVHSFTWGMGVSVRITAGPGSKKDDYLFIGVGANFVQKP